MQTTTTHDTALALEIAESLATSANLATAAKGDQTRLLSLALQDIGYIVSVDPSDKKKSIAILEEGAARYDEEKGAWTVTDDKALGGALQLLIDRRDSADDAEGHLTGEAFTEAKRTFNKVLSNISNKWQCDKVAAKGSKSKGYYFEVVQPADDAESSDDAEIFDGKTFEAELNSLISNHLEGGVDLIEMVEIMRATATRAKKVASGTQLKIAA